MTSSEEDIAAIRDEVNAVERRAPVDLGLRAIIIAVAVFVLIVGYILPWMGDSAGWQVLLGTDDAAGRAGTVPRLFAGTSLAFGIVTSALALALRRWPLIWAAALGGWFAAVDGLLAIWTRQSTAGLTSPGPGIGLAISEAAMVVTAALWLKTAWTRPPANHNAD
ncbi:hypothetical protein V5P93_006041 [Actinokineospora auranticolor]|uniref:Uncharacterized protein n=1 Tax=Actinokineospora auranticolor TaxID=155976 RepID=A0A2S6GC98_9PSEU|nr:hypothetical protein [Actinokineospora auranticolor]PPK62232.1 hypothetical protein CLV40_13643 [Actinokineospora auranticolor]